MRYLSCSTSHGESRPESSTLIRRFSCHSLLATLLFASSLALPFSVGAESTSQKKDTETAPVVFVPPVIGVPSDRIGAGTRDLAPNTDGLTLLVPDGGGLTTSPKPPLIWKLDEEFTGVMQAQITPIHDAGGAAKSIQGRFSAGYYALDLNRSEMSIVTGKIYRWTVRLVDETTNRVLAEAEGLVERIEPSGEVGSPAQKGLWFDAIAQVFEIDLSGRARLANKPAYLGLAASAGVE